MTEIVRERLVVGLEIHVELATRTKMFSRSPSPACATNWDAEPNTLIDSVVLGLPGALPVLNRAAIEMSMRVGLALGCSIATTTKWDRKSYFYPDLPKNYQISQYDLPLCYDGAARWPIGPGGEARTIGIVRAHLEEDAGKLLHEWPGGGAIEDSIVDLNRAGTPLLEIVTAPDFGDAGEVVRFAQILRNVCRFLCVTEGVMQRGHMRFEPNINMELELADGRLVRTPIVEVKNLNSFRALAGAIEYEQRKQPERWRTDGREIGPGTKSTHGWDESRGATVLQREKEDAHDYRYFPDPDLPLVRVDAAWIERVRGSLAELPHERAERFAQQYGLSEKEAAALTEERDECVFYEACIERIGAEGAIGRGRAGRLAANLVLQTGRKFANERGGALVSELGITPEQAAELLRMREEGVIGSSAVDGLFAALCASDEGAMEAAERLGMVQVRDEGQLDAWCARVIGDPAHAKAVEDVRSGKDAAIGRLVGAVMKLSGGRADAQTAREKLLAALRG